MPWTRAIDFDSWANDEASRGLLPLLVRRLIAHTAGDISKLNIPAQEQVGRPGFDGNVEVVQGNRFVPAGRSVWEMGVSRDARQKGNEDFAKRSTDASPDSTFVFVTPRSWPSKDEWAKERVSSSTWKSVIVYDANDLEHWLEMSRGVDAWISTLTRRLPSGIQSLADYWKGLSAIAAHPLLPDVFVASRESEVADLMKWLYGTPDSIFLHTASLYDGVDFLSALAARESLLLFGDKPTTPTTAQVLLQDAVIVHSAEDWRQLSAARAPLLLASSPKLLLSASDVASAVEAGHFVFVSGPRGIVPKERSISLRGLTVFDLQQSLNASGFSDAEASQFAKASCGSSTILKRRIARHPEGNFPAWSLHEEAIRLAPFALIGEWRNVDPTPPTKVPGQLSIFHHAPPMDVDFVTSLVGCDRSELDRTVARLSNSDEPFFLRIGESVLVTSREDGWTLLGHAISEQLLKRFVDLSVFVLDENNPALDLEADKRWMASLFGKSLTISRELRRALFESLALMAVLPTLEQASCSFTFAVRTVVDALLPKGASWQRWASIGENLQAIAEADPELFLQRVEDDLDAEVAATPLLFTEHTGGIFGRQLHCDLLWSLETLAWSPQYLLRVAIVLAKLTERIPLDFKSGNSPGNSLREIFLLWLWHTNANTEERVGALQKITHAAPDTGWSLLKKLLPSDHSSISHNTALPRWRNWANGWSREVIGSHIREYALAVGSLAIRTAGDDPSRWADIIDKILRVSRDTTCDAFASLDAAVPTMQRNTDSTFKLWNKLRQLISRHRRYEDADWAFDDETLTHLSQIRDAIAPSDPVLLHQWLFRPGAELDEPRITDDYKAHDEALNRCRRDAMREIVESGGGLAIGRLLELGADPHDVGWILAEDNLVDWHSLPLNESLLSDDPNVRSMAESYVLSMFHRSGWTFVRSIPTGDWAPQELSALARSLPHRRDVWDWVASLGEGIEDDYWKRTNRNLRDTSNDDIEFAVNSLIRRGRTFAAIRLLRSPLVRQVDVSSDLIGYVLEAGLKQKNDDADSVSQLVHEVSELIKSLQEDESFDRTRLALIEWGYLPLLDNRITGVGPDTLTQAVAKQPQLFAEMISVVYRSEEGTPDPLESTEVDEVRIRRAHDFLDGLNRLPGIIDGTTIDLPAFESWIGHVRSSSQQSGHAHICELVLGQFLARMLKNRLDDPVLVAEIGPALERIGTEQLFRGLVVGLLNNREASWRGPLEGGSQERNIASRFRDRANTVRMASRKLAAALDEVADSYEARARREDEEAERLRLSR